MLDYFLTPVIKSHVKASILDVLKYLSAKETESKIMMKKRDAEFHRREAAFREVLESEIYDEVNLDAFTDGVNMFKDPKIVDPFFEKNIITDYVMTDKAKELFIPENMHHPWTGDGGRKKFEVNELPMKRQAGQTMFPGDGVRMYERIYI